MAASAKIKSSLSDAKTELLIAQKWRKHSENYDTNNHMT